MYRPLRQTEKDKKVLTRCEIRDIVYTRAFKWELGLAVFLCTAALIWGLWPLFGAANNTFLYSTDGLGHFTRIVYLANHLLEGKWVSWFPFWYNGSTVIQYYPPLSFLLFTGVQMLTQNILLTFKIMLFLAQLTGALGVWYFCYRFIAPRVSIIGGILYALQPFLLQISINATEIAQIPIFALTPWFLTFTCLFCIKRTRLNGLAVCLSGALLILSHSMHAFLISILVGVFLLVLLIQKQINLRTGLAWVLALGLGAGLCAFWVIPGITQLENPGIPYLLPEASSRCVAQLTFFSPLSEKGNNFYLGSSMLLLAGLSLINGRKKPLILALFIAMLLGIALSFGENFPLYQYLPMHASLIPRRFLSFSVLAAAILSVFTINTLYEKIKTRGPYKILYTGLIGIMLFLLALDLNPRAMPVHLNSFNDYRQELASLSTGADPFTQGRFSWLYPMNSHIAYFPMLHGLNMTDGWTIEGTPHNRTFWQHNQAVLNGCYDYIIRNLSLWNTRSLFVSNNYPDLITTMEKEGFNILKKDEAKTILYHPAPSSYFLYQDREALVMGHAALNLEMYFPWMVRGYSPCLEDYPLEYLANFKLIYLIEPEIKNLAACQKIIADLAAADKMVIISMGREKIWPLFELIPYWETLSTPSRLKTLEATPFSGEARVGADPFGQVPALGNLDAVWAIIETPDKKIPALGYKKVNGQPVYFLGLALGQQLSSPEGVEIRKLMEQLMDLAGPKKNIIPRAFPVHAAEWVHNGFQFTYNVPEAASILVSVTFTPRWQALLDGQPLPVQNMDNLIQLNLPAGEHQVTFVYKMTWVGKLGIALSLLTLIIVIQCFIFFDRLDLLANRLKRKTGELLMRIEE